MTDGEAGQHANLARPGEPDSARHPSPNQGMKLMEGTEEQPEHDHDFVDFAETFLSSEPFVERPQEGQPQSNQLPGSF